VEISFTSVAVVAAVAVVAPLALGVSGLRFPAIVLEILLGILVGPQVLGWASADEPVRVLSIIGLAFLLLLAGLEVDYERLRGRLLRLTAAAYALSFALALLVGLVLDVGGLVRSPLLIAIVLSATGLGVILPILKDAGETSTPFGQVVIAGASIAEVVPIVLLSLFFSGMGGIGAGAVLLAAFAAFVLAVGAAIFAAEHAMRLSVTFRKLQDTTAEIRVRSAFLLLIVFVVLAAEFGLEAILGAFLAGAVLKLLDRDDAMTHTFFRPKLEAVGFGVFVPFFFVATGLRLDVESLFESGSALARVPIFLGALLLVRGVPALLYRPLAERREQLLAGGLLQATSLSFLIVAGQLGVDLDLISPVNYTALVAAGLLSVIAFPLAALTLLRRHAHERPRAGAALSARGTLESS
jgi:Kef-type K+ transport system membrane component KefB